MTSLPISVLLGPVKPQELLARGQTCPGTGPAPGISSTPENSANSFGRHVEPQVFELSSDSVERCPAVVRRFSDDRDFFFSTAFLWTARASLDSGCALPNVGTPDSFQGALSGFTSVLLHNLEDLVPSETSIFEGYEALTEVCRDLLPIYKISMIKSTFYRIFVIKLLKVLDIFNLFKFKLNKFEKS